MSRLVQFGSTWIQPEAVRFVRASMQSRSGTYVDLGDTSVEVSGTLSEVVEKINEALEPGDVSRFYGFGDYEAPKVQDL